MPLWKAVYLMMTLVLLYESGQIQMKHADWDQEVELKAERLMTRLVKESGCIRTMEAKLEDEKVGLGAAPFVTLLRAFWEDETVGSGAARLVTLLASWKAEPMAVSEATI